MKRALSSILFLALGLAAPAQADQPVTITLRVTGIFSKDREADLRLAVGKIDAADFKIERVEYQTAEVIFSYNPAAAPFKPAAADAEKLRGTIDNLLKNASNHTFGALLPSGTPVDKLERVEICVAGLDCKACSYAAYRAIYQIDGVTRATASFKMGKVTALIDPKKTDRSALEEALKNRGVTVKQSEKNEPD